MTEKLNLSDAFAKYGGKAANRQRTSSAIAADGSMILSCSSAQFAHPAKGVLRYEDRLSRESEYPADTELLGQHLAQAREGDLPVRMVVITYSSTPERKSNRSIHVRADLVGRVTTFDGDHFIVDFVRSEAPRLLRTHVK